MAQNIQIARKRSEVDELPAVRAFQPGELVTLRDYTAKAFDPKYKGEYQIIIEEFQGRRSQTPCSLLKEDKSSTGNNGENTRFQKV